MTTWDALTPDEREALTALLDVDIAPNFRIFESLRARGLIYEKRHPDTDELFHFLTLEGHALVEANAVAGLTETEVGEPKAGGDNDLRLLKATGGVPRIDVPLPPASYSAEEYQSLLDRIQDLEQKLTAAERQQDALADIGLQAQLSVNGIDELPPRFREFFQRVVRNITNRVNMAVKESEDAS